MQKYDNLSAKQLPWIKAGYQLFAIEGPKALKVEVLARMVGKNKSSFYHHFADMEVYTNLLLSYHLERASLVLQQEAACQNVVPELLNVLLEHKEDLLFNRQLRIHRHISEMAACFAETAEGMGEAIGKIWAQELGLADNSRLALLVLNLSLENFYLQITEETLTFDWLEGYVNELRVMVEAFGANERLIKANER